MRIASFLQSHLQRVGLYALSNIMVSGSALILVMFMTRYLPAADLGVVFLGQTFTLVFATLIGLGSVSIIQPVFAKARLLLGQYVGRAIVNAAGCFLALCVLVTASGPYLADVLSIPVLLLWLALLTAPLIYLVSLSQSSFQMTNDALRYFIQICWSVGTSVPLTIVLVLWITPTWTARITALLFGALFAAAYGLPKLLSHKLKIGDSSVQRTLLIRGLPVVFHSLSTTLFNQTDKLLIGASLSASDVGIYGASAQFASVISTVGATLAIAYTPSLYQALKGETSKSLSRARSIRLASIVFILAVAITLGVGMTAYHEIILGPDFDFRSDILIILCIGHFSFAVFSFYSGYFYYSGDTLLLASLTVSLAVLNGFLAYYFIETFGLIGPAYSISICFFLLAVCVVFYARRIEKELH